MKHLLFDLQLFAEDGGNDPEENQDQGTDQKDQQKKPESDKRYTDEDLDKIISRKFAKWQKQKEAEIDEAKKLAEMNEAEKAQHERDKIQKELDEYKKKDTLARMASTARTMLKAEDITVPDELLNTLISEDADQTKETVEAFAKVFKEAVEAAVLEKVKGRTPKAGTGGAQTMTKEQIMAIADQDLRQKRMLEHKELFNF